MDEYDAIRKGRHRQTRCLQRKARLADASRSGERRQTSFMVAKARDEEGHLLLAADERPSGDRQHMIHAVRAQNAMRCGSQLWSGRLEQCLAVLTPQCQAVRKHP
jgi:hypothetical protein